MTDETNEPIPLIQPITELIIQLNRFKDSSSETRVRIDERGDLRLEGSDAGRTVEQFFGTSDYEFALTIPAIYKDTVLLHLIKDRFTGAVPLKEWCRVRGIPCGFDSWVSW